MQAANHLDFIIAAYGAAVAVVGALIAWVLIDYRTQQRRLADLESRGVVRRSATPGPALARAREDA
jgi:heme exporter protein D